MGFAESFVSSIAGRAPRAMLFVQKRATSTADDLLDSAGDGEENQINKSVSALRKLAKQRNAGKVSSRMGKLGGQVQTAEQLDASFSQAKEQANETDLCLAEKNFLRMDVQYNPSSISFSTSAGRQKDFKPMGDSGAQQLIVIDRKATTLMNVQLVFEDVNSQDAFIRENLNPNVGNLKDMAADVVTKLAGGYSIKDKVEGLVAILTFNRTRNIIFVWADMFFHGQLNSIDATYTMFNKKGEPIKATVNLTIRQAASGDEYLSDNEYWNEAFKAAFKDHTSVGNIGGNISNDVAGAVGNLLS